MRISLSLLAFMILFTSCDYFGDPGSDVILNVDTEFEINLKEVLYQDRRELSFEITSVDKLQCEDTELDLDISLVGTALSIAIKDITMPSPCGTNESYPKGNADFGLNIREYIFGFQVQEQQTQFGDLIVTSDRYYLDLQKSRGLLLEIPELHRIPDSFVWGHYQAKNAEEEKIFEDFLKKHNLIVRPFTYLEPGHYSYFNIDNNGNAIPLDLPSEGIVKALAFNPQELDFIKQSVSNFKLANPDLSLILNGSDGSIL